jgi:hypothetical protein
MLRGELGFLSQRSSASALMAKTMAFSFSRSEVLLGEPSGRDCVTACGEGSTSS